MLKGRKCRVPRRDGTAGTWCELDGKRRLVRGESNGGLSKDLYRFVRQSVRGVWRGQGAASRAEVMMACTKAWMWESGVPKSSNRARGAVQTGGELERYMITFVLGFQGHAQEFRYMLNSRGNDEGFNGVRWGVIWSSSYNFYFLLFPAVLRYKWTCNIV